MGSWFGQLSALDGAIVILDVLLVLLALGGAIMLLAVTVPALRRSSPSRATTVAVFAGVELAALVVVGPIFWASASSALATFGAESMMPVMLGPAARVACVLLLALVAANVAVVRSRVPGDG